MSAKKKYDYISWQEEFLNKQQKKQKEFSLKALISKYEWLYLAGMVLITIILGYIGFYKLAANQNLPLLPSTILYNVIRLFILDNEFTTPVPWELEIARFLAPAFLAYAGLKAILMVFQENIQVFRLRFFKNHTVICGLGNKGLYLARDFINNGINVVVIEKNRENDHLQLIKKEKAVVLIGDATDRNLLQKAKVHQADSLIVVSGDDGVNVEIAVNAYNLVNSLKMNSTGKHRKVKCYVHLVDLHLRTTLSRHTIFTNPYDLFVLNWFNSFENAARLLFHEYPIEKLTSIDPSTEQIHLVIIGLGRMGQSVLIQASKVLHYSTSSKLYITVVDKEAEIKVNSFKRYNPHFTKVIDLHYENLDVLSPKLAHASFWTDRNTPPVTLFIICINDDALGLTTALTLLKTLENEKVPILVRMNEYTGLATLLFEQDFVKNNPIYPFGMTSDTISREILLNESLDTLAKIITPEEELEQPTTYIPAELEPVRDSWSYLSETLKESTRHQADHLEVKLRNIDCAVEKVENRAVRIYELTPKEVEKLAQLEHTRWLAERQLDGWTHTKGEENSRLKTSPYLVSWEKLSEAKKERYRRTVGKIPKLLADYGFEIQKLVPYHRPTNLPPVVEHVDLFKGSKNILLTLNYSIATNQFSLPPPIADSLNPEEWLQEYQKHFSKLAEDPSIEEWIKERLNILINGPQSLQNFCLADALIIAPPLEKIINPLVESLVLYGKAGIFEPKGSGKSLMLLYLAHEWTIKNKSPVLHVDHVNLLTKKDWEQLESRLINLSEIYGFEKRLLLIFENLQTIKKDQLAPLQRIISLTSGIPVSVVTSFTTSNTVKELSGIQTAPKQKRVIDQLITMVQTPKLNDFYQLANTWKTWREYFSEWVSLVSYIIFDAHIPGKISPEIAIKTTGSAPTPLEYVSKETDFSLIIKARKWKEEGNYEKIINSVKVNDEVIGLNWYLVDAYLEIENQARAQEILEQIKNKAIMPLDTARWNYYYGRMLYNSEDYTNAFNYIYKAVNQPVVVNHFHLHQEITEWLSNPVKKYLNFDEQIHLSTDEG